MRIAIDIVLAIIMICSTWMGYKRGLINTVIGLLIVVISVFGGSFLSAAFSGEVAPAFQPFADGIIESKIDDAMNDIESNGMSLTDMAEQDPGINTRFTEKLFEEAGIHSRRADDLAQKAVDEAEKKNLEITAAAEKVFCESLLYVAGTVLAAVLILMLLTVIENLLSISFHVPNHPKLEINGGIIAGFVKGMVYCVLLCWILSFFGFVLGDVLNKSLLTKFFLLFEFLTTGIL